MNTYMRERIKINHINRGICSIRIHYCGKPPVRKFHFLSLTGGSKNVVSNFIHSVSSFCMCVRVEQKEEENQLYNDI